MKHEFPFGTFRPEKQDCLFRCSVTPGKFALKRPKKSCSMYFPTRFSRKFWIMVNNLTVLYIPVTSSRSSSCFNIAVSTEEPGVRVLAVGGETDVFVVVLIGEG